MRNREELIGQFEDSGLCREDLKFEVLLDIREYISLIAESVATPGTLLRGHKVEGSFQGLEEPLLTTEGHSAMLKLARAAKNHCPACRDYIGKCPKCHSLRPTKPVCTTCNDTHRMVLEEREVMCTQCPTPCKECREKLSAYCKTTPCDCACHERA